MRIVLILVFVSAALAGCGSQSASGRLTVVAAENEYGDIAAQIGGSRVMVTSILTNPNADPHLFEPGTSTGLAVAKAKVIIQNGLGYDAFMSRLENASPNSGRIQVTIADALGIRGKDANPHLWYDVPVLDRIASAIESALVRADGKHASDYAHGLARFERSLASLRAVVARIRRNFGGQPVAYTEPVPEYLIAASGLRNLAPETFTRAIEDGTEPPPSAVSAMLGLAQPRRVRVLLYNSQAVSPITKRVRTAARHAGVPIVGVTETLPPHMRFQEWQTSQAEKIESALGRSVSRD